MRYCIFLGTQIKGVPRKFSGFPFRPDERIVLGSFVLPWYPVPERRKPHMVGGALTVGRPRKRPGKPKPGSEGKDDRSNVIVLKGSTEYVDWFNTLHEKTHIPKATIVRLALADWAKKNGHSAPPEM